MQMTLMAGGSRAEGRVPEGLEEPALCGRGCPQGPCLAHPTPAVFINDHHCGSGQVLPTFPGPKGTKRVPQAFSHVWR